MAAESSSTSLEDLTQKWDAMQPWEEEASIPFEDLRSETQLGINESFDLLQRIASGKSPEVAAQIKQVAGSVVKVEERPLIVRTAVDFLFRNDYPSQFVTDVVEYGNLLQSSPLPILVKGKPIEGIELWESFLGSVDADKNFRGYYHRVERPEGKAISNYLTAIMEKSKALIPTNPQFCYDLMTSAIDITRNFERYNARQVGIKLSEIALKDQEYDGQTSHGQQLLDLVKVAPKESPGFKYFMEVADQIQESPRDQEEKITRVLTHPNTVEHVRWQGFNGLQKQMRRANANGSYSTVLGSTIRNRIVSMGTLTGLGLILLGPMNKMISETVQEPSFNNIMGMASGLFVIASIGYFAKIAYQSERRIIDQLQGRQDMPKPRGV